MPYCPKCGYEYNNKIKQCSDCNVPLVVSLESDEKQEMEYVEIYLTNDSIEANMLLDLLTKHKVDATIRDLHISALPVNVGEMAEVRVEVPVSDIEKAKKIIKEAIDDEYISKNGQMLDKQ